MRLDGVVGFHVPLLYRVVLAAGGDFEAGFFHYFEDGVFHGDAAPAGDGFVFLVPEICVGSARSERGVRWRRVRDERTGQDAILQNEPASVVPLCDVRVFVEVAFECRRFRQRNSARNERLVVIGNCTAVVSLE